MKNFLRKIRLILGKCLIDTRTLSDANVKFGNVLFLRQDGKIGDYIVSSFVFRELKKLMPEIEISIVCGKYNAYLFQQNPYIDHIFQVKKRSILDYIRCGLRLRKLDFDLIIDPTVQLKNRDLMLLRLIKAKHYVGYKKADYQLFDINIEGEYHFAELYQLALQKVGVDIQNTLYDVPYNAQADKEIQEFLQENQLDDFIAVNFYGSARNRKVNQENIQQYLAYFYQHFPNQKFLLLSYPEVTPVLNELAQQYPTIFVHDTKNIFHTIELIRHCRKLISTDTSSIHMASGFNKEIIAWYKDDKENFQNWKPRTENKTHILYYQQDINELKPEQIKPEWLK